MQEVPPAVLDRSQPHPAAPDNEHIAFPAALDLLKQPAPQGGVVLIARADQQHFTGLRLGKFGNGHDSPPNYERRSLAVTGNIHPNGFNTIMPKTMATATVHRLMHHAHMAETSGESRRPE
ncbi:hypothetical protein GCM10027187_63610 [Streptosporangium sandarakinum]